MTKISGIFAASMSLLNNDLSLNVEKTIKHAEQNQESVRKYHLLSQSITRHMH